MKSLEKILADRQKRLISGIQKAEKDKGPFPEGHLRISGISSRKIFYHVSENTDKSGKYIPPADVDIICGLAQKEYRRKFLRLAKAEMLWLKKGLRLLEGNTADAAFERLLPLRKTLIRPYIVPDEVFAAEWQAAEFNDNPYMPEARIYETRRGEKVRSKSEAIIADLLDELSIPYHYEKPLELGNGIVKYPDFTLLDVHERREIYWEHFGLLGDPEYVGHNLSKLDLYRASGVFFGKNLIVTYEDDAHPLDTRGIRKMLEELFGSEVA